MQRERKPQTIIRFVYVAVDRSTVGPVFDDLITAKMWYEEEYPGQTVSISDDGEHIRVDEKFLSVSLYKMPMKGKPWTGQAWRD